MNDLPDSVTDGARDGNEVLNGENNDLRAQRRRRQPKGGVSMKLWDFVPERRIWPRSSSGRGTIWRSVATSRPKSSGVCQGYLQRAKASGASTRAGGPSWLVAAELVEFALYYFLRGILFTLDCIVRILECVLPVLSCAESLLEVISRSRTPSWRRLWRATAAPLHLRA
jgi:hypothetical protein